MPPTIETLRADIKALNEQIVYHEVRALMPPANCSDVELYSAIEASRALEFQNLLNAKQSALEVLLNEERMRGQQLELTI